MNFPQSNTMKIVLCIGLLFLVTLLMHVASRHLFCQGIEWLEFYIQHAEESTPGHVSRHRDVGLFGE